MLRQIFQKQNAFKVISIILTQPNVYITIKQQIFSVEKLYTKLITVTYSDYFLVWCAFTIISYIMTLTLTYHYALQKLSSWLFVECN